MKHISYALSLSLFFSFGLIARNDKKNDFLKPDYEINQEVVLRGESNLTLKVISTKQYVRGNVIQEITKLKPADESYPIKNCIYFLETIKIKKADGSITRQEQWLEKEPNHLRRLLFDITSSPLLVPIWLYQKACGNNNSYLEINEEAWAIAQALHWRLYGPLYR